jgi:signal peptidase
MRRRAVASMKRGGGARRIAVAAIWLPLALALAMLVAVAMPRLFGGHTLTVMSGSMEPAIATGDLVISRQIAPLEAVPGDVVTFRDPDGARRLITHRVTRMKRQGREVRFVTKGDANNASERWSVATGGQIGRVVFRLPKLGYLVWWSRSPSGRIVLLVIPALLLCCWELVRIWRPGYRERPAEVALGSSGKEG